VNSVYLDSKYNEYLIDDEAYQQVEAIVHANKHCMYDYQNRHRYTADNPCVGKNICLEHLLLKQRNLTRLEIVGVTGNNRSIYYFLDVQGFVSMSTEDSSEQAQRDVVETLTFYGFTPPKTVESRGKTVDFYSYYATLHGDLKKASVIVMSYNQSSEKVKGLFLLYKNGKTIPLSKRGEHKSLYTRADELVEASKDIHNEYHIGGVSHYGRYESDTYEVISQLESAMYDVSRKLQNTTTRAEEEYREQESLREESTS
jgi:hypothetical protein